jgi:hypothetical protein
MTENSHDLFLIVSGGPKAGPRDVYELAQQLIKDLRGLDSIESVQPLPEGAPRGGGHPAGQTGRIPRGRRVGQPLELVDQTDRGPQAETATRRFDTRFTWSFCSGATRADSMVAGPGWPQANALGSTGWPPGAARRAWLPRTPL